MPREITNSTTRWLRQRFFPASCLLSNASSALPNILLWLRTTSSDCFKVATFFHQTCQVYSENLNNNNLAYFAMSHTKESWNLKPWKHPCGTHIHCYGLRSTLWQAVAVPTVSRPSVSDIYANKNCWHSTVMTWVNNCNSYAPGHAVPDVPHAEATCRQTSHAHNCHETSCHDGWLFQYIHLDLHNALKFKFKWNTTATIHLSRENC